jgi:hypothetical protein
MKTCTGCSGLKPPEDYYRDATRGDGRMCKCKECVLEIRREYRERPGMRERQREYLKRPEVRARSRKSLYGITDDDYKRLLEEQGGVCAICGSSRGWRELCVDHCHDTKRVRGLLCSNCNTGLGFFLDNPALLIAANEYLAGRAA